jgi:hypothetical protein
VVQRQFQVTIKMNSRIDEFEDSIILWKEVP